MLRELNLPWWWDKAENELDSVDVRPWIRDLELWHQIAVLAGLEARSSTERKGVRAEISSFAEAYPVVWAASLPWLFRVGPEIDDLDVSLTAWLAQDGDGVVAQALNACTSNSVAAVRLRAIGTRAFMDEDRGDRESWVLNMLAANLDRVREKFPRPLAGPAATWLSDIDLEGIIRGSGQRAMQEFAGVIRDQGAAEEEGHTQQLLALLSKHFENIRHALTISRRSVSLPQIELAQRTVPKSEENLIGADLGIVVQAELPGELAIRFGDLVQVKKTKLFTNPRGRVDSWRIEIRQLKDLLRLSPTSAYWMICRSGEVFVVPGKLLEAVQASRTRPAARTFTVQYNDVRHVAIPLDQYLCDLMMGMWLGTAGADALTVIDGTNSRTRPRRVLEIQVRVAAG